MLEYFDNELFDGEVFLDRSVRCNGKTTYYLECLKNNKNVVLLVNSISYRKQLRNLNRDIDPDQILVPSDFGDRNIIARKICKSFDNRIKTRFIIDNRSVEIPYYFSKVSIMNDDEIREMVLWDLAKKFSEE